MTAAGDDQADAFQAGVLAAAGATSIPIVLAGNFNLEIKGVFVGAIALERSFDGGTDFVAVTNLGSAVTFTGPASEVCLSRERGVLYRLRMVAYTSGAAQTRLSQ